MSKVHHRVTGQKIIQNTYMIWSVLTSDFNVPSGIYNPGVRCLSPGLRGTGRICLKSEHMFCVYDVFSCRNVLSHQAASPTTGPWQTPFSSHSFSCWQHAALALTFTPNMLLCQESLLFFILDDDFWLIMFVLLLDNVSITIFFTKKHWYQYHNSVVTMIFGTFTK